MGIVTPASSAAGKPALTFPHRPDIGTDRHHGAGVDPLYPLTVNKIEEGRAKTGGWNWSGSNFSQGHHGPFGH